MNRLLTFCLPFLLILSDFVRDTRQSQKKILKNLLCCGGILY